ncbi:embryonic polyadenylate-binding protein 2 isoform X1 [Onychostruthus taczanowskii]|uniref:embryonic polyadenylate-binding protein 2 isoform X1 n=1 Tax=Onychostruthus taczanowskii TaxID=356909 RepID=UPI001B801F80|nr:embryonic polyadenylate-binding protein 2 isoform X1 [Onychostruthus taczanowskii]
MIIIILMLVIIIRDVCQIKDEEEAWSRGAARSEAWHREELPLFLDTSEIWWQDPPSLQAEAAPWDVTEVAAVCKAADEGSDPSPQEGNSTEEQAVQDPVSACLDGWGASFPWCPREMGTFLHLGCPCSECCSCNSWFGIQELEAIKAKLREIEQEDERLKELQLEAENHLSMSSEAALFPLTTKEKMEADQRSIYVGNVDYGGTAEELESHFNSCGQINRVTILCDKFSGHPKGSVLRAGRAGGVCGVFLGLCSRRSPQLCLHRVRGAELREGCGGAGRERLQGPGHQGESWGEPLGGLLPPFPALPAWGWAKPQLQQLLPTPQVLPKRTNMPGISSTDRGGYRGCCHARGGLGRWGGPYGQQPRLRGRAYRGRARLLPWYFPY